MFDLISIGGISIDLFYKGRSLTFDNGSFQLAVGGKYITDHFSEEVGGSGANVAIGVTKYGFKAAVCGIIGNNPFKSIILDKLKKKKVSVELCTYLDNYINISSILLTDRGERSIISYRTPHRQIVKNDSDLEKFISAKMVFFGNLPEVPLEERMKVLNYFKKNQIPVVMNAGLQSAGKTIDKLADFLSPISILILNTHEFADMVNKPYKTMNYHENIILKYVPYLTNKIVIVTDSQNGSYGYHNNKFYYQPANKIKQIIDTTGAGDAYTSGFIGEYIKSKNIVLAMKN